MQAQTAYWMLYHRLLYNLPPIILVFPYGLLSDDVSRRAAIALPCLGHAVAGLNLLLCAIFMDSHVGYTLISPIAGGLTGCWVSFYMASYSYLAVATTRRSRTFRISIAQGVASVGYCVGYLGGGPLLDHTNYVVVFSVSGSLFFLATLCVYVWLREPPKARNVEGVVPQSHTRKIVTRMKDAFMCVFRKRSRNGRAHVLVCLFVVYITYISYTREYSDISCQLNLDFFYFLSLCFYFLLVSLLNASPTSKVIWRWCS